MKLLVALTYYTPHISGLTLYARRLISGLTERGNQVEVETSRFDPELPATEIIDGARVRRNRVWLRLSKGVFMPGYVVRCCLAAHRVDVVNLHLPQIEATLIAFYAKFVARTPVYTTYHCDLELPPGWARLLFTPLIKVSHLLTVLLSDRVIVNTEDYVTHSRFLRHFRARISVCFPPCARMEPTPDIACPADVAAGAKLVGFVGRFAEEKGVQYIVEAVPRVAESHPDVVFAFAGEVERAIGERVYERLKPRIDALGERVQILGVLSEDQLAALYHRCDVLVLPSVNSTESFGMVQIEAMYAGVPVIATDIPGVRVPVAVTGMGELIPPHDAGALASAINRVLGGSKRYVVPPDELERTFGVIHTVDYYERLFAGEQVETLPAEERVVAAVGGATGGGEA